jgi:hypothetical protein
MVNAKQINSMQGVDITTVDKSQLTDVSGIDFDNSLPQGERAVHILNQLKNPYCFRYGDAAVKVEFPEDGHPYRRSLQIFLYGRKAAYNWSLHFGSSWPEVGTISYLTVF